MIDIPDSFFPKDSEGHPVCPRCFKLLAVCDCPAFDPARPRTEKFSPRIRLDKSGRSGKSVTVIDSLPRDEGYLKELSRKLKVKTGSGGTFYLAPSVERPDRRTLLDGVVEVQGDHQKVVIEALRAEKFHI